MKTIVVENIDSKKSLPIIKCECGFEILLIPDLKEMNKVIREHAEVHMSNEKHPALAKAVFEYIQLYLIKQIFDEASH